MLTQKQEKAVAILYQAHNLLGGTKLAEAANVARSAIMDLSSLRERREAEIAAYEQLRPVWVSSLDAQSSAAALAQLWGLLGAKNQTEAVAAIKALKGGGVN